MRQRPFGTFTGVHKLVARAWCKLHHRNLHWPRIPPAARSRAATDMFAAKNCTYPQKIPIPYPQYQPRILWSPGRVKSGANSNGATQQLHNPQAPPPPAETVQLNRDGPLFLAL